MNSVCIIYKGKDIMDNITTRAKIVEIAALFHDIGKLEQHTLKNPLFKHTTASSKFIDKINLPIGIDKNEVKKLIETHHEKGETTEGSIEVKSSDWTSAAMDRERNEDNLEANLALKSIFNQIFQSDNPIYKNITIPENYYKPKPLDISDRESIFPTNESPGKNEIIEQSKTLWDEFTSSMETLPENMEYNAWMTTVEAIMRKYLLNALSAGYKNEPIVSLYHHLSTTAALARAQYEYNHTYPDRKGAEEEKRYLLVRGDINGIQRFIFSLKSSNKVRKNTSKRLRGRSFIVQLINDAIVSKILDEFDLTVFSIVSNSAGNFTIIVPNMDDAEEKLQNIHNQIQKELAAKFDPLSLSMGWIPASNKDMKEYANISARLGNIVANNKLKPYRNILISNDEKWNNNWREFFNIKIGKQQNEKITVCDACYSPIKYKETNDDEVNLCNNCKFHMELGEKLTSNKYILKTNYKSKAILDIKKIYQLVPKFPKDETGLVIKLQNDNIRDDIKNLNHNLGYTYIYAGISLPKYKTNKQGSNYPLLTFSDMANLSIGRNKLGILKADIDNLGKIFNSSLTNATLAKYRDLSFRIDLFFSGYVPQIAQDPKYRIWLHPCEKHIETEFKKVTIEYDTANNHSCYRYIGNDELKCSACDNGGYTTGIYGIFSGGDDLSYIGPWDMIVEFSKEIHDQLKEYVANNPFITISASVNLENEKTPLIYTMNKAEENLEQSKSYLRINNDYKLKNSITIFGETVLWDKIDEQSKYGNKFGNFKNLFEIAKEYEKNLKDKSDEKFNKNFLQQLILLWDYTYRDLPEDELRDNRSSRTEFQPLLAYNLKRRYPKMDKSELMVKFDQIVKIMPWIRIPVSWAYYRGDTK